MLGFRQARVVAIGSAGMMYIKGVTHYNASLKIEKYFCLNVGTLRVDILLSLEGTRVSLCEPPRPLNRYQKVPVFTIGVNLDHIRHFDDPETRKMELVLLRTGQVRGPQNFQAQESGPAADPTKQLVLWSISSTACCPQPQPQQSPTNMFSSLPQELKDLIYDEILEGAIFVVDLRVTLHMEVRMYLRRENLKKFQALASTDRDMHVGIYRQAQFRYKTSIPFVFFPNQLRFVSGRAWRNLLTYRELRIFAPNSTSLADVVNSATMFVQDVRRYLPCPQILRLVYTINFDPRFYHPYVLASFWDQIMLASDAHTRLLVYMMEDVLGPYPPNIPNLRVCSKGPDFTATHGVIREDDPYSWIGMFQDEIPGISTSTRRKLWSYGFMALARAPALAASYSATELSILERFFPSESSPFVRLYTRYMRRVRRMRR